MKNYRYQHGAGYIQFGCKVCKVCENIKKTKKDFRCMNVKGHTSTTCKICESKMGIHKKDINKKEDVRKVQKTQRICIVCNKLKGKKAFRVIFAPTSTVSKTCKKCEKSNGLFRDDDTRLPNGFMYVLIDSTFPELIKIGCTTNLAQRIWYYNENKPIDTCSYVYTSKEFKNVFTVEKHILKSIKAFVKPIQNKKEWFSLHQRDKLIDFIRKFETKFSS